MNINKIIFVVFTIVFTSVLSAATRAECNSYKSSYNHYVDVFSSNSVDKKKYPLLMVKSYLDSIMLECDGVIDISFFKNQTPEVKRMWNKYIPISTRNLPENKWKY